MSDDLFYGIECDSYDDMWSANGPDITNYAQALHSISVHFSEINGRLANGMHYLFQPLPRTVEIVFASLAMTLMLILLARMCRSGKAWLPAICWSLILMWTALPWWDHLQSLDFQMNYTVSSAICLTTILLYGSISRYGIWSFIAFLILCFIAGWWHEGFAVALAAYFGLRALTDRKNKRRWAVVCAVAAGTALNMCLGTFLRIMAQMGSAVNIGLSSVLSQLVLHMWPLWLATVPIAISLLRRRQPRELMTDVITLYAAALCSALVALAVRVPGRGVWAADLFAVMAIVRLSGTWLTRIPKGVWPACGILTAVLYGAWLWRLTEQQKLVSADLHAVARQFEPRGPRLQNIAYRNFTTSDEAPWWLLDVANQPLEEFRNRTAAYSYYCMRRRDMSVAPEDVKGKKLSEWPLIAGNARLRGRWPMVYTDDTTFRHLNITFGSPHNMPPVDRLLSAFRPAKSHIMPWWPIETYTETGDTIYLVNFAELPRTLRHRPVLRIDVVSPCAAPAPANQERR